MTTHVGERFEAFDLVGAYAASVVLALLAMATLLAADRVPAKEETS